eukprot:Transcript_22477.p3 GENE.Transcript_22477~~Transcript_22477.p3  ORF type:complete len:339 (+),score=159.92 Transcript_22477:2273-3289(+)
MVEAGLPHPFDSQEQPLPLILKIVLIVLSPLLLVLTILRILLFILCMLSLFVVCSIATIGKRNFEPLTGMRFTITRVAVTFIGRVLLMSFGCWPCLYTVNGKWDKSCPTCAAGPHSGTVDAFVSMCLGLPRPVILEPYTKIPVVREITWACGALPVPIASSAKDVKSDGGGNGKAAAAEKKSSTNATAEAILKYKRSYDPSVATAPIVLFAEGITHSGCQLLPFFRGAFEGGSPVQPVLFRYHFRYHNAAAYLDSLGAHLLGLFATPWMRITIDYLPPRVPTPEEVLDGQLMAEAVRVQMAAFSGLPLHTLGARELRKEMKEQAAEAKARKGAEKELV